MNENSVVYLADKAHDHLVAGQLNEAKEYYERLCHLEPKNEENWLMLATVHGELGQFDEALSCANQAIELDKEYVEAYLARAHLLSKLACDSESLKSALKAVDIDDEYTEAWIFLAGMAGRLKRYEDSEAWALRALTLAPENTDALANLASARYELTRYAEAETTYREVLHLQPDHFQAQFGLAKTVAALQRYSEAIALLEPVLKRAPKHSDALDCLAICYATLDRRDEAQEILEQIIQRDDSYIYAYMHLANLLKRQNKHLQAIQLLRKAKHIADNPLDVLGDLAQLYCEYGMHTQAIETCSEALVIDPTNPVARFYKAKAKADAGRYEEALAEFALLESDTPDDPKIPIAKAGLLEKFGEYEKARDIIEPFLAQEGTRSDAVIIYARMCHRFNRCEKAADLINDTLQNPDLPSDVRRSLLFALGRIYDRLEDFDRAFKNFQAANELKPYHYDHQHFSNLVDRLTAPAVTRLVKDKGLLRRDRRSVTPVFIVGMPRSGTSLVEQIIASHPEAFGGGERLEIPSLAEKLPLMPGVGGTYPECLDSLTPALAGQILQGYEAFTETLPPDTRIVTDKLPGNFQHLIFIRLLFPDARIIHCVRNPLDTCISIYSQDFTGYHDYAYNLSDLGKHFREYNRLMRFYRDETRLPLLNVPYEDLINDTEAWVRKIIDHCGLEWNDQCLRYYESDRVMRTASYDQVRQPIYRTSLDRWKNYEPHLKPLMDELQGLI